MPRQHNYRPTDGSPRDGGCARAMSSSEDDLPLSSRLAPAAAKPAAAVSAAPAAAKANAPSASPAYKKAAAKQKRKREPAPAAARAGVSGRAARTGAGGWSLSEAAGDLDEQYETLGVLGRGNFAEVNLVRHRTTSALCALKFCCKLDAPSFTHLRAEAALASRIEHPFVLSPLAVSDSPGRAGNFSVLLPLCPGGDLLQLMRQHDGHTVGEASARAYGAMIVLALSAIHDAGLAYRDLKPENLLLRSNGYLVLADFGFTAPFAECRRARVGTTMYQAPELIRKQPHGAPVDWWALGCLLFELATGTSPFARDGDEQTEAAILAHTAGAPLRHSSRSASTPAAEAPEAPPASDAPSTTEPPTDSLGEPAAAPTAQQRPAPSSAMSALCAALLTPDPEARLGSASAGGVDGLRTHGWFEGLDWTACLEMSTPAPFVPPPLDDKDSDAMLLELSRRCQQGFDF